MTRPAADAQVSPRSRRSSKRPAMALLSLFSRKPAPPRVIEAAPGERIYAIGDIHGRADCLNTLIAKIDADDAARSPAQTRLVFLGDLIDRGPTSREVIERALAEAHRSDFIIGNHEEVMIRAWEGERESLKLFHRIGGRETVLSYGVTEAEYDASDFDALARLVATRIPVEHISFLRRFRDHVRSGDYLFVHAGIRPGVAIDEQAPADMRWIRREFLEDRRDHGVMVIHGHTVVHDVDEQANRIGIDTGAYASGRLTALGIEGRARWFLST